ncbi:MAG TPA: alpha/beta hydrolase [Thermoanaerobaculia bacterium]|nr:alpha/beta hydrolase [Thermoanaerobaculia bacterium]
MYFEIQSNEGLLIRGDIALPDKPRALCVIVHGFKGFRQWGFFPWLAEHLAQAKVAACRFDMSRNGVGESGDSFDRLDLFAGDTYSTQLADLQAVVRHCYSIDRLRHLPIFLLGHSRGGGVSLLGAHEIAQLAGVITWSSISHVDRWDEATLMQWRREGHFDAVNMRTRQIMRMSTSTLDDWEANAERLDIRAAASSLRVPLLVIHGGRDESVPLEEASEISGATSDASLLIIGNASHTYNAIHPLVKVPRELRLAAAVSAHFVAAYW